MVVLAVKIRLGFPRAGNGKGEIIAYPDAGRKLTVGEYRRSGTQAWTARLWATAGDSSRIAATLTAGDVAGLRDKAREQGKWWR
jgi:hypothetical protein